MKKLSMKLTSVVSMVAMMFALSACSGEPTPSPDEVEVTPQEYREVYGTYSDDIMLAVDSLNKISATASDAESAKAVVTEVDSLIELIDSYADVSAPAEFEEVDTKIKASMAQLSNGFKIMKDEMLLPLIDVFENGAEPTSEEVLADVLTRYTTEVTLAMTGLMEAQVTMEEILATLE